jgi:hypothetical protein
MNSSRVLSLGAVGLALLITVPPKLRDPSVVQQKLSHNLEQASAGLLAREGFETTLGNRYGFFLVTAQKNDCHVQIQGTPAEGFDFDAKMATAPKDSQLVFEYRGKLWTHEPTLRATITEFLNRLKWRFDLDNSWSPVISILASGPCAIEKLPWEELASIEAN